jgi:hypothetical protein
VFFVYDGGQHGLIAATVDQSEGIRWYGGSYTITRARADGIGAGLFYPLYYGETRLHVFT